MKISSAPIYPLGIAHFTTIGVEPLAYVEMAARIGYARVGLRLWPAFPGAPFYEIPRGGNLMKAMKRALAASRVTVFDVEFVVVDAGFKPASLAAVLESAGELGAKRVSVCGDDPEHARLVANVAGLAALAAPFGMAVDIENMPWRKISSFTQAVQLAKDTGAANVGALVDALHFMRGGGVPADIETAATYVRHFQLCDTTGPRPASNEALIAEARGGRRPPGEGDLPLSQLLGAMPDECVMSVEVPVTSGEAEDHARRVFDAAQRVIRDYASKGRPE